VAARCGGATRALALDVTDTVSVEGFAAEVGACSVLVNNAGGALGLDPIAGADEEQWRWMYDANVLGVMRVTRALLPALVASGDGRVVNVGSIAGLQVYEGGAGYTAAKHGLRAVTETLRRELLGQAVRVTEGDPGMVETEFSLVRFGGDAALARERRPDRRDAPRPGWRRRRPDPPPPLSCEPLGLALVAESRRTGAIRAGGGRRGRWSDPGARRPT